MWRTIFLLEYEDVALTFEVETFIIRVFDTVTSEMQSQSTIGKNFDQITICCANLPEIYLVLGRNKTMIQNVELLVVVDPWKLLIEWCTKHESYMWHMTHLVI